MKTYTHRTSKVLGSMLGNSFKVIGSNSSMNGTMTNTANGT
jgi:hypothetical protein